MLQVLTINHPKHGSMNWYFECSVDDADNPDTEFAKAKALAQDLGIYVEEDREELITEFFEFENAMREDGLIPQEDELTELLHGYVACHDALVAAAANTEAARKHYQAASDAFIKANNDVKHRMKGLVKTVNGRTFVGTVKGGDYVIEEVNQA